MPFEVSILNAHSPWQEAYDSCWMNICWWMNWVMDDWQSSHRSRGDVSVVDQGAVINCTSPGASWLPKSKSDRIKRKRSYLHYCEVQVLLSSLFIHSTYSVECFAYARFCFRLLWFIGEQNILCTCGVCIPVQELGQLISIVSKPCIMVKCDTCSENSEAG